MKKLREKTQFMRKKTKKRAANFAAKFRRSRNVAKGRWNGNSSIELDLENKNTINRSRKLPEKALFW